MIWRKINKYINFKLIPCFDFTSFSSLIFPVTERGGADVDSAQVGDALELHFEIFDQQSPYEIFVRDLVAKDGNDNNEIVLIGTYLFTSISIICKFQIVCK